MEKEASEHKERCESIGNIAVCLYYLSTRARASGMTDLAQVIEESVTRVVGLGAENYREYLQGMLAQADTSDTEFVRNFCPVNDETVRLDILEILSRRESKRAGTQ
jgi:hypothetical protein